MKIGQLGKYLITYLLFGITFIAILAGCSAEQPIDTTRSPTTISTEIQTVTFTKTPRPTRTNTPTITSTFTITPNADFFQVEQIHVTIQESIPDDIMLSGSLLISDTEKQEIRKAYFYNLENDAKFLIDDRNLDLYRLFVSPDNKWISYYLNDHENNGYDILVIKNQTTDEIIDHHIDFASKNIGIAQKWLNKYELLL
ncbi:MAG: hypothetical protein JEZ00_01000 [Anaerolineaceae bacterium]|nr:hypothetical protein [Anaerolineaceae bacterium]